MKGKTLLTAMTNVLNNHITLKHMLLKREWNFNVRFTRTDVLQFVTFIAPHQSPSLSKNREKYMRP